MRALLQRSRLGLAAVLVCGAAFGLGAATFGQDQQGDKNKPGAESEQKMAEAVFEEVKSNDPLIYLKRANVPGGWLVSAKDAAAPGSGGFAFVYDPEHTWGK